MNDLSRAKFDDCVGSALAAPRDGDALPRFDFIEEFSELGFRLKSTHNDSHGPLQLDNQLEG